MDFEAIVTEWVNAHRMHLSSGNPRGLHDRVKADLVKRLRDSYVAERIAAEEKNALERQRKAVGDGLRTSPPDSAPMRPFPVSPSPDTVIATTTLPEGATIMTIPAASAPPVTSGRKTKARK